jgi:hypothetical protein
MENPDWNGGILPEQLPGYVLLVTPVGVLFLGNEYSVFRGAQTKAERAADPSGRFSKFENGRKLGVKRTGADGSMKHKVGGRREHASTLSIFFQIMAAGDNLSCLKTPLMTVIKPEGVSSAKGILVDAATVGATDPNVLSRFLSTAKNLQWAQWVMLVKASKKTLPEIRGGAGAKTRFVHIKTFCKVLQMQTRLDQNSDFGGFSPNATTLGLMSPEDRAKRHIYGTTTIAYVFEVSCHLPFECCRSCRLWMGTSCRLFKNCKTIHSLLRRLCLFLFWYAHFASCLCVH